MVKNLRFTIKKEEKNGNNQLIAVYNSFYFRNVTFPGNTRYVRYQM